MVDLTELVETSKQQAKALIGLPPSHRDLDATVVFLIGTRAHFKKSPVQFDEILDVGVSEVMQLDHPTNQQLGMIEDQMTLQITVPDVPNALIILDDIHDKTSQAIFVADWATSTLFSQLVFNHVVLQVQANRLKRAELVAKDVGIPSKRRAQALIRTAKLSRSVRKRGVKQAKIVRKIKSPARLAGRVVGRTVLRAFIVVGLILDVIMVSAKTVQGAQRGGVEGAIGAFVGGVADAITLGIFEEQTEVLALKTEESIRGGSSILAGMAGKDVGLIGGSGGFA